MPLQILPKFWQNCSGSRSQKVKFSHKKTGKNFVSGLLWGYLYYSTVVPHIFLLENILDRELLSLSRVEWFSTSFFFWKRTHFCWSGIFSGTQFQKIGNFSRARRKRGKLSNLKNHWDLKKYFILKFLHRPLLYIKEQSTKIKFVKYFFIFLLIFIFPKWAKLFFDLYKVKINIFEFLFIFSF